MIAKLNRNAIQDRQRKVQGTGRAKWHQRQLSLFLRGQAEPESSRVNRFTGVVVASAATEFCEY